MIEGRPGSLVGWPFSLRCKRATHHERELVTYFHVGVGAVRKRGSEVRNSCGVPQRPIGTSEATRDILAMGKPALDIVLDLCCLILVRHFAPQVQLGPIQRARRANASIFSRSTHMCSPASGGLVPPEPTLRWLIAFS
jgi:hypothetical protein